MPKGGKCTYDCIDYNGRKCTDFKMKPTFTNTLPNYMAEIMFKGGMLRDEEWMFK